MYGQAGEQSLDRDSQAATVAFKTREDAAEASISEDAISDGRLLPGKALLQPLSPKKLPGPVAETLAGSRSSQTAAHPAAAFCLK